MRQRLRHATITLAGSALLACAIARGGRHRRRYRRVRRGCYKTIKSTTAVPYRAELRGRASARARPVAARATAGRPPPSTIAPAAPARRPRSLGPTTVVAANAAAGWPGPSAARGTAPTVAGGAAGLDRRPPTVRPRRGALVMPVLAGGARAQCEAVFGGGPGGAAGRSEHAVALGRVEPTGLRAKPASTERRFWTSRRPLPEGYGFVARAGRRTRALVK